MLAVLMIVLVGCNGVVETTTNGEIITQKEIGVSGSDVIIPLSPGPSNVINSLANSLVDITQKIKEDSILIRKIFNDGTYEDVCTQNREEISCEDLANYDKMISNLKSSE